ncbi:phytoene desaturase family protein [Thermodesulfovibrio hydrogeniphilus]
MKKIGIVGAGIGGLLTGALLSKKGLEVEVFEKSKNIGGCSGSFKREGRLFNIGATTLPGLLEGYPVDRVLKKLGKSFSGRIADPSIVVIGKGYHVKRYLSLEKTIDEVNRAFPIKGHEKFWKEVWNVTDTILGGKIPFINIHKPIKSLKSFVKLLPLSKYYFLPALQVLKCFYGNSLNQDYLDFIRAHVLVTAQANIENVNALTMFLALGYPFTGIAYPEKPMGTMIEELFNGFPVYLQTPVKKIRISGKKFVIDTENGSECYDKIVLAFPFIENLEIIEDEKIKKYLEKFKEKNSDKGACVLYGVLKNFIPEHYFYLIPKTNPKTKEFSTYFVSFMPCGEETIFTVSTHVPLKNWIHLSKEQYDKAKLEKIIEMKEVLYKYLNLKEDNIDHCFLSTPITFKRYLGRVSQGGIPITRDNTFWRIPQNFTPFENLYLVGDMSFAYQGWIGVSIGVLNLMRGLDVEGV